MTKCRSVLKCTDENYSRVLSITKTRIRIPGHESQALGELVEDRLVAQVRLHQTDQVLGEIGGGETMRLPATPLKLSSGIVHLQGRMKSRVRTNLEVDRYKNVICLFYTWTLGSQ